MRPVLRAACNTRSKASCSRSSSWRAEPLRKAAKRITDRTNRRSSRTSSAGRPQSASADWWAGMSRNPPEPRCLIPEDYDSRNRLPTHSLSRERRKMRRRNTILIYGTHAGRLKPCHTAEKSLWKFLKICSVGHRNLQAKESPLLSAEVLNFLPPQQRTWNCASFEERLSFRSSLKNFGRTGDRGGHEFANRPPVRP